MFDSQAPIKSKALRSLRVRGSFRRHALLPCERDQFQDKHCSQDKCDTLLATGSSFHHAPRLACVFAQKIWILISQ